MSEALARMPPRGQAKRLVAKAHIGDIVERVAAVVAELKFDEILEFEVEPPNCNPAQPLDRMATCCRAPLPCCKGGSALR